jgi:hypothetical protein
LAPSPPLPTASTVILARSTRSLWSHPLLRQQLALAPESAPVSFVSTLVLMR